MSFEEAAMRIDVLVVPDCPNGPVVIERLAQALAGRAGVQVTTRVIDTARQAEQWGMHGSPTVLVDGRDPFAAPGTLASLSCRLYQDEGGQVQGAPSLARLRQALDQQQEPTREIQRCLD
jgi:predicted DsbA family dithiol-disulfide isomerase